MRPTSRCRIGTQATVERAEADRVKMVEPDINVSSRAAHDPILMNRALPS